MISKEEIIAVAKECNAQGRVYKTSPGLDHFLLETAQLERFANHFYEAGAASRDAEVAELKDALGYDWDKYKASQMALRECMQRVVEQDAEIAELVAALKPFGAIDLVESRLPAEFAMLILRARAALAKVRKP